MKKGHTLDKEMDQMYQLGKRGLQSLENNEKIRTQKKLNFVGKQKSMKNELEELEEIRNKKEKLGLLLLKQIEDIEDQIEGNSKIEKLEFFEKLEQLKGSMGEALKHYISGVIKDIEMNG